jgi:hypothetical protein
MSSPTPQPASAPKGPKKIALTAILSTSASVGIGVPAGRSEGGIGSSTPMGRRGGGAVR